MKRPGVSGQRRASRRASASRAFDQRARAIELGLEERGLGVEHFGVGDDAGGESLADDAPRFCSGAHAVSRRGDRGAARLQFELALPNFEGDLPVEVRQSRLGDALERRGIGAVGLCPAAVPQVPRGVDRDVPGVVPAVGARERPRVGPGVVVAAADADLGTRSRLCRLRPRVGRPDALGERFPLGSIRDGLRDQAIDILGAPLSRLQPGRRLDGARAFGTEQAPKIRLGNAAGVGGLDGHDPFPRLLRLRRQAARSVESIPDRAAHANRVRRRRCCRANASAPARLRAR